MQDQEDGFVVILSGGMDSTTALYWALNEIGGPDYGLALSFDYGQRHKKELKYAQAHCEDLGVEHHIINLTDINKLVQGSALTQPDVEVPEGHYSEETMAITVVPNRNAIMANIAIGAAVSRKAQALVLGIHAGDHAVYPDCRPEFINRLEILAHVANEGFIAPNFAIAAPFLRVEKSDIVRTGEGLGVNWKKTWTCYKGGDVHCGRCSTCVERLEAFHIAGATDTQEFVDTEYWKTVCNVA